MGGQTQSAKKLQLRKFIKISIKHFTAKNSNGLISEV